MKFYDFLDCNDVKLELQRHPNQNGRWTALIEDSDIKEGAILSGSYGNANNPTDAINDYIRKICGKRIVVHAMSNIRREFVCPTTIEFLGE